MSVTPDSNKSNIAPEFILLLILSMALSIEVPSVTDTLNVFVVLPRFSISVKTAFGLTTILPSGFSVGVLAASALSTAEDTEAS